MANRLSLSRRHLLAASAAGAVLTGVSAAHAATFGNPDEPPEGAVNVTNPKALTDPGPQDQNLAGSEPAFLNPPPTDGNGSYSVNGVLVSDFYTPNYFDPVKAPGVRYSFTGALTEPRQVLPGGYLSWQDTATGHWWQEIWFGDQPQFRDLGKIDQRATGNIRAFLDRSTMAGTLQAIARGRPAAKAAGITAAAIAPASSNLAAMWRARTAEILEGAQKTSGAKTKLGRRPVPQIPGDDED